MMWDLGLAGEGVGPLVRAMEWVKIEWALDGPKHWTLH
jgi:hypothetical protein